MQIVYILASASVEIFLLHYISQSAGDSTAFHNVIDKIVIDVSYRFFSEYDRFSFVDRYVHI